MDSQTHDQFIQELKDFMAKPCFSWVRNEYNRRVLKKLEDLHKEVVNAQSEANIRVRGGELSGFRAGFDLMETLINEHDRKE